jgi:hypothetical protein
MQALAQLEVLYDLKFCLSTPPNMFKNLMNCGTKGSPQNLATKYRPKQGLAHKLSAVFSLAAMASQFLEPQPHTPSKVPKRQQWPK